MSQQVQGREGAGNDKPPVPVFGVNEVRLGWRGWLAVVGLVLGVGWSVPRAWRSLERFETGRDYRLPYALSRDYWLYQGRLEQAADPQAVFVLGDSVVWGEYVAPDGTLSHFLDRELGVTNRFLNAGVNGLFPLALEGLVFHYGGPIGPRKVLLHCNPLWMSSPKADLSSTKAESFNHARLVPQFRPAIPCYRAEASERIGIVVGHALGFFQWVDHLENVYFDQKSLPAWTLADEGGDPLRYPNLWRNPLRQISLQVPSPFGPDPERGSASPRHRAWNAKGTRTVDFEWVPPGTSLQWAAFRRLVVMLRERGADVLVVVGPFNESMLGEANRLQYARIRDEIASWLATQRVPHLVPAALPAALYADASHPLTEGYALLARQLSESGEFRKWLGRAPGGGARSSE